MLPIRKVAVAIVAALVIQALALIGVELPDDQAQDFAEAVVPLLLAYWVRDPQVDTGR